MWDFLATVCLTTRVMRQIFDCSMTCLLFACLYAKCDRKQKIFIISPVSSLLSLQPSRSPNSLQCTARDSKRPGEFHFREKTRHRYPTGALGTCRLRAPLAMPPWIGIPANAQTAPAITVAALPARCLWPYKRQRRVTRNCLASCWQHGQSRHRTQSWLKRRKFVEKV